MYFNLMVIIFFKSSLISSSNVITSCHCLLSQYQESFIHRNPSSGKKNLGNLFCHIQFIVYHEKLRDGMCFYVSSINIRYVKHIYVTYIFYSISTILDKIFVDFLTFQHTFLSQQVKRNQIIITRKRVCKVFKKLPNDLRLTDRRKSGNLKKIHKMLGTDHG